MRKTCVPLPVVPAATSVLKPKPKLPPSKWQIYFAAFLRRERDRHPGEKMNVANIARDAAVAYKTITVAENDVSVHFSPSQLVLRSAHCKAADTTHRT